MEENKEQIFWLDGLDGEFQGGYFVRNPLKEFFEELEKSGRTPVGIKYDGSYDLEIIVKEK